MLESSGKGKPSALVSSLNLSEKEGVFSLLSCPPPHPWEIMIQIEAWSCVQRYVENSADRGERTDRGGGGGRRRGEKRVARGSRVETPRTLELEGSPQILPNPPGTGCSERSSSLPKVTQLSIGLRKESHQGRVVCGK